MRPVGYATPGKALARELLEAFCAGAGGKVVEGSVKELLPGPAAFYGVTPATAHLWRQAKAEGRDWYYIDNAYFDKWRGTFYRVTLNALQHHGCGRSDGKRFESLGVQVMPWRSGGEHICIAPQSDEFMQTCAGYKGRWVDDVHAELQRHTRRDLLLLPWSRDKREWYRRLPAALAEAHALVTFSSASSISAILAGVPAVVTAHDCITRAIATQWLDEIESLERVIDDRRLWAGVVADNQWTLDEMRSTLTWRMLQNEREGIRAA